MRLGRTWSVQPGGLCVWVYVRWHGLVRQLRRKRSGMWQTLHLDGADNPLAVLAEGPALRIRRSGIADAFAPLGRLARVVVHGVRVQWRTEALVACLNAGVLVIFLGSHGDIYGLCIGCCP